MAYEACLTAIKDAAGVDFSDDELERILDELLRRKALVQRRLGAIGEGDALRQAAVELGEREKMAAAIERRNALLNLQARLERRERIGSAPNPVLGIQAEIHGVNTPMDGSRFSAEAESKALNALYQGGVVSDLERAGLFDVARRGDLEKEWVAELFELSKGPDGKPGISKSAPALEIAKILHRWQTLAKQNLNEAGAWIGDYSGYVTRTAHDPDRIRIAGFDAWRAALLDGLDKDRTFADVADPEKFVKGVYNALTTGVHLTAEGGGAFKEAAFSGPGNLAKRLSSERVLHWRDAEAWRAYQQRFGDGNAMAAVVGSLGRASREAALMRRWGTNPRAEFEADLRHFQEKLRDSDPDQVRKLRGATNSLQNRFDFLDGTANMPVNRLGARVSSALRVQQSLAKLGGVAITHAMSLSSKAAELRYHGIGFLQGYGDVLQSFTRGRGSGQTREIMDLLGAGLEGMQRDLVSRFEPDDGLPGKLSKLANTYFKWSGLTYLVNAQKAGAAFVLSRHLGSLLDHAHGDLPVATKRLLKIYGIKPEDWEALRQAPGHVAIGDRKFLTPDAASRAGDEDLAMKLHALYHDVADRTIITPGLVEDALLLQGSRPGTVLGEALRFFAQFKKWPLAAVRQGLGREIYGGQGKAMAVSGIVHMAVGSIVLGYLRMALSDMTRGVAPRNPTDPKTWLAASAQGGGLGIFGDYLFGEYSRFGHNFAETFAGPVLGGLAGDVIQLWNEAKEGKGKDLPPALLHMAVGNTPFANLFYVRAALNYLLLYQVQEALNPGYLRRMERHMQQDTGQHFFVPPSTRVPFGGGGGLFVGVKGR